MTFDYNGSVATLQALAVSAALGASGLVKELREWRRDQVITASQEAMALHEIFFRLAVEEVHREHPAWSQYQDRFWLSVNRSEAKLLRDHGHRLYAQILTSDVDAWWEFSKCPVERSRPREVWK